MNFSIPGSSLPVTSDLPADQCQMALQSHPFKDWFAGVDPRFELKDIHIRAIDFRGTPSIETVLFIHLTVQASERQVRKIVTLRGHTAVMLPILLCEGIPYTILTKQPRIAIGEFEFTEAAAGMTDGGTFIGAAAREIEEELSLTFAEEELHDITPAHIPLNQGIAFSPGLLDEQARFYVAERRISHRELHGLQGKATGLIEEGETITLQVVRLDEVSDYSRDGKLFIALALYHLMRSKNR